MADVATLAAKLGLHVQRCSGAALPMADIFAALGLIERHHVEIMRNSTGAAYAAAESVRAELSQADCRMVMLYRDDDCSPSGRVLAGFMAHRISEEQTLRVVYVLELHLERRYRRHGLGSALVAEAQTAGEAMGASGLMLTCDSRNSPARSFYSKLAFIPSPCSPPASASWQSSNSAHPQAGEHSECLVLLWSEDALSTLERRAVRFDPSTCVTKSNSRLRPGSPLVEDEAEDVDEQGLSHHTPKRARVGQVDHDDLEQHREQSLDVPATNCALIHEVE